jgi:hypothetical protein
MKRGLTMVWLLVGCQSVVGIDDDDAGPDDAGMRVEDAHVPDGGRPRDAGHDAYVPGDGGTPLCGPLETWPEAVANADTGDHCAFGGRCGGGVFLTETDPNPHFVSIDCVSSVLLMSFGYRDCGPMNEHTWEASECDTLLDAANHGDACVPGVEGASWSCFRAEEDCCFETAICREGWGLSKGRICSDHCEYALPGGRVHDACPIDGDWIPGEPCEGDWTCRPGDGPADAWSHYLACRDGVLVATAMFDANAFEWAPCLEVP